MFSLVINVCVFVPKPFAYSPKIMINLKLLCMPLNPICQNIISVARNFLLWGEGGGVVHGQGKN